MWHHDRGKKGMISLALLTTTFITNIVIIKSKDEKRQCNQTVFVDPGSTEEMSLSVEDFEVVNSRLECSRLFIPNQLDTHFTVEAPRLYHATVNVTGYDPQGFYQNPLMSTKQLFKDQSNRSNKTVEKFNHMAIKVKVRAGWRYNQESFVQLHITLRKNEHPGIVTVHASEQPQYIVSPNYPLSYGAEREFYVWHILSSKSLRLQLTDMDVGTFDDSLHCQNDRLFIGPGSEIFESMSWPLCGLLTNYTLDQERDASGKTHCCDVTVKLVIERKASSRTHRGFMIRFNVDNQTANYKMKKSDPVGIAVGATTASLILLIVCVASAAVLVMRFRRIQYERHRRRRRQFIQAHTRSCEETPSSPSAEFRLEPTAVTNPQAPPPPYPGRLPPQTGDNNNDNNDNNNGERNGTIGDSGGQGHTVVSRTPRDDTNHNGGDGSANMEDPPPYHPLMSRGETANQRTEQLSDEPPAYEDSSPLRPPPTYGEATNS